MKTIWDHPDALTILRKLWTDGVPTREMAARMSHLTGFSITHNSVIGKVHRLGLTPRGDRNGAEAQRVMGAIRSRANQIKKARPAKPKKVVASLGKAPKVTGIDYKLTPASDEQIARCAAYGRDRVEWVESGAGVVSLNARPFFEGSGCKWPLAGGMRCCNPISRGQYCAGHAAVAFEGTGKARPDAPDYLARHDRVAKITESAPTGYVWDEARMAA